MRRVAQLAVLMFLLSGCTGSQATVQSGPTPSSEQPGLKGDTWTWDGASWHREAATGPSSRYLASLAFDAKHKVYVMFGGQTAKGSSDETWTWDGSAWKAASPVHKPPPRRAAGMAYDPAHQVVVLYGGLVEDRNEGDPGGDTWTWDGVDWTQIDVGPGVPGKRDGPQLIAAGNRVVLFGGHYVNVRYFGDAWTWGGKTWSRIDKDPKPPGRGNPAVAWDPSDSSLFVYGGSGFKASAGIGAQGEALGDGWSLTGARWTQLKGSGPPALAYANAIWDAANKRDIVLLGMPCPKPSDSAWAWDGNAWSRLAAPGMSARWGAASAQDADGKALLFGGSDEAGC
ncbi:MAG: hypothetical protein E6J18_10585 [Chloroflexi bacterium]|nr:MAG: hypothetical protein E6J18_10585 [Chloroflexota bacterium]